MRLLALLLVLVPALAWGVSGVDTLIPTAASTPWGWDLSGGSDSVVLVVPPDDGGTTTIGSGTASAQARYALSNTDIPAGATYDSVVMSTRAAANPSDASYAQGVVLGADSTQSSPILAEGGFTTYATVNNKLACPDGGAWSEAHVNDLLAYVKIINDVHTIFVTTICVLVYYTDGTSAASGGLDPVMWFAD